MLKMLKIIQFINYYFTRPEISDHYVVVIGPPSLPEYFKEL